MSGRKIVGSAAEGLISILYCESLWAVSRSPPTQKWRMAEREGRGQRWRRGCRGPDGGCGKSRKTASQRQARCWGWWGGEDGGGAGGLEAATVKSGSVRELGSSSTAKPRLHDEVMKTKWILSDLNCVYVLANSPWLSLNLPVTVWKTRHRTVWIWKLRGRKSADFSVKMKVYMFF